jgi:hypothetical protein
VRQETYHKTRLSIHGFSAMAFGGSIIHLLLMPFDPGIHILNIEKNTPVVTHIRDFTSPDQLS